MLFRKNRPFKIGQKVLVIDFSYNKDKEVIERGKVVAKRLRLETREPFWVYLVKLDNDKIKTFGEEQVWLAEEVNNENWSERI